MLKIIAGIMKIIGFIGVTVSITTIIFCK